MKKTIDFLKILYREGPLKIVGMSFVTGDDRGQVHVNWRQFYFLNLHRPWKREKQHSMICVHFRFLVVLIPERQRDKRTRFFLPDVAFDYMGERWNMCETDIR